MSLIQVSQVPVHGSAQHNSTTIPYYHDALSGQTDHIAGGLSQAGVAGRVFMQPLIVPRLMTFDRIGWVVITAGGAGTTVQVGIYNSSSHIPDAQSLVLDAGTSDATVTGLNELTISQQLSQGLYFLALETQDATILFGRPSATGQSVSVVQKYFGCYYDRGGGYGALTNPCPATTQSQSARPTMWLRALSVDA